jgi:hypothetical protein
MRLTRARVAQKDKIRRTGEVRGWTRPCIFRLVRGGVYLTNDSGHAGTCGILKTRRLAVVGGPCQARNLFRTSRLCLRHGSGVRAWRAPQASSASFSIMVPSASIPAVRQNRSKLTETASQALPTAPIPVGGEAIDVVLTFFMALLSFVDSTPPSLPAQGEQRRSSYFNIRRGNPSEIAKALKIGRASVYRALLTGP